MEDMDSPMTQIEAGKVITTLARQKKRLKYRELVGFSPKQAAESDSAKKQRISAEDIARAAGRT